MKLDSYYHNSLQCMCSTHNTGISCAEKMQVSLLIIGVTNGKIKTCCDAKPLFQNPRLTLEQYCFVKWIKHIKTRLNGTRHRHTGFQDFKIKTKASKTQEFKTKSLRYLKGSPLHAWLLVSLTFSFPGLPWCLVHLICRKIYIFINN